MMTHNGMSLPRELSVKERVLVEWLAHNPTADVNIPISELKELSVASTCRCGCPSIGFAINGSPVSHNGGKTIVADYMYRTEHKNQMGCFLFMANGHIAGLEVWSLDGVETPNYLPNPIELESL